MRTDEAGKVIDSVPLPRSLVAESTSSGFEGVAVTGSEVGGDETVWAVIQREWGDDPPGSVKIGRYDRRVLPATDNDGVDENYGETLLFGLGPTWSAFGR